MTNAEIRAELRRSACEDEWPFHRLAWIALHQVHCWKEPCEWLSEMRRDDMRTLYLLVAEAME